MSLAVENSACRFPKRQLHPRGSWTTTSLDARSASPTLAHSDVLPPPCVPHEVDDDESPSFQPNRLRHILTASNVLYSPRRDMDTDPSRELNVVFVSTGCTHPKIVGDLLQRLADVPDVAVKAVLDTCFRGEDFIRASSTCLTMPNAPRHATPRDIPEIEQEAAELCEWANVLVLAPIDANNLAKMLHGHTDNLLLEILRSWDASKRILLLPGMSSMMWENPMTKKQLTKIRKKWIHVQVLQPLLWVFEQDKKVIGSWEAADELIDAIRNQVDLENIGQGMQVSPSARHSFPDSACSADKRLPPELWTMIFDFAGDWELAQHLHVYTNLPPPAEWTYHTSPQGPRHYMESLELTLLQGNLDDVKHFIATRSVPRWLSKLCVKLIMRLAMTPLLKYLEAHHNDLFWATFGNTFLPDKASALFGRTEILEFWRTSPSFTKKEYHAEAVDGASRAGFVNVLEWWQQSGLPLKFTEAALEQASSQGHIPVLDWWKAQSTIVDDSNANVDSSKVRLRPGKSICFATQNGRTDVVRWWLKSGIAFPHEDTVAKLASTHGHVDILQLWHDAKGSKMIFDNQVLISATKGANVEVLEWWKQSGLKVEYKMFELEEAFEDGYEGERGEHGQSVVVDQWIELESADERVDETSVSEFLIAY